MFLNETTFEKPKINFENAMRKKKVTKYFNKYSAAFNTTYKSRETKE